MKLLSLLSFALPSAAEILFAGVAESGGEFGSNILPGRYDQTYKFIDEAGVDVFVDEEKVNLFRVAFLLERMCPLDVGLGAKFNETHFDLYKEAIDSITVEKGAYAILDPHNYMRYNDPSSQPMSGSIIGDTTDPTAASTSDFAAFWSELASRFASNEKVLFGIMNEPHDMPTSLVFANNQAAVTAIRDTGAKNMILIPGNNWSGGHSWTQNWGGELAANSAYMGNISDPLDNFVMDIHEYLDEDFSGTMAECVHDYPTALAELTAWLKANNLKAMITEFGGSPNCGCKRMLAEALDYMAENPEYIGWTAWAAGPFWGSYSPCCAGGAQLGSLEPGSTTADGEKGLYDTVWKTVFSPRIPEGLQWDGPAVVE